MLKWILYPCSQYCPVSNKSHKSGYNPNCVAISVSFNSIPNQFNYKVHPSCSLATSNGTRSMEIHMGFKEPRAQSRCNNRSMAGARILKERSRVLASCNRKFGCRSRLWQEDKWHISRWKKRHIEKPLLG